MCVFVCVCRGIQESQQNTIWKHRVTELEGTLGSTVVALYIVLIIWNILASWSSNLWLKLQMMGTLWLMIPSFPICLMALSHRKPFLKAAFPVAFPNRPWLCHRVPGTMEDIWRQPSLPSLFFVQNKSSPSSCTRLLDSGRAYCSLQRWNQDQSTVRCEPNSTFRAEPISSSFHVYTYLY